MKEPSFRTAMPKWKYFSLFALINYVKIIIVIYFFLRLYLLYYDSIPLYVRTISLLFFMAECFFLIHAYGYLSYVQTVTRHWQRQPSEHVEVPPLTSYPPVAIVVASYKEPLEVLEDTLVCFHNLTYPNKHLYFLDDTRYDKPWDSPEKVAQYKSDIENLCKLAGINLFRRKWHHAKAGMINDFLQYIQGSKSEDFTLIPNGRQKDTEEDQYIIIFDADMNPLPDFVEPLVGVMESQPDVAFVQTPQYYTNFRNNRVAKAASSMQAIFFEWICEAKGIQDLMIFCGTNVILRIKALKEVGGIDLSSVTEDFATTFALHKKHWRSLFVSKVCAFGMGPEDLGAFFKQQHRWALGTVGMLPKLISTFLKHPFMYPLSFWKEYFLSSSYYIVGWMYFLFILSPLLYVFLDMRTYLFPTYLYAIFMIPYVIITNFLFYWTLNQRGYRVKDIFSGVLMGMLSSPVFAHASAMALLGIKSTFVVTPKGESNALPLIDLWPQLAIWLLTFSGLVWSSLRLFFEGEPLLGLTFNTFWLGYYFLAFSTIFYFNKPEAKPEAVQKPIAAENA